MVTFHFHQGKMPNRAQEPSQSLLQQASALLISRYVSYATNRLPEKVLLKAFPEAATLKKFNRKAMHQWEELWRNHNQNIERGIKMRLLPACRAMKRFKFDSLDIYMLTMHGNAYVEALLSIAAFGERVQKARDVNHEDDDWCIIMPFFITRDRWALLRKRVKMLVLGIKSKLQELDAGPYNESLNEALHKVSIIF